MTATLRDIRRRIQSVENVKQITKAMEMVAVARLHKAQTKAEQSHEYASKIKHILHNLAAAITDFKNPLLALREVKKIGVVIVAGDKGLCGPYNTYILSAADRFLKTLDPEQVELILIGHKAVSHYRHKKWKIRYELDQWGGKINFHDIKVLANDFVKWFLSAELDEIWLIYTHFISISAREVVREKFLGLGVPQSEQKPIDYIFEPSAEEIYDELLPRYCISKIQTILDESYASELAARAFAMRKATNNAVDMIETLTLLRNKIRQTGITREMIEITSGAEGTN